MSYLSGIREHNNSGNTPSIPIDTRPELPDDLGAIRLVNEEAFGQPDEADLVDALRNGGHLHASSVAVLEGDVVGHAALSHVQIGRVGVLSLAPVGVLPAVQGKGVGTAVVKHVLEAAENRMVTVLGDPRYYERFGFQSSELFDVTDPFDATSPFSQVLNPDPEARGTIEYTEPFLRM